MKCITCGKDFKTDDPYFKKIDEKIKRGEMLPEILPRRECPSCCVARKLGLGIGIEPHGKELLNHVKRYASLGNWWAHKLPKSY